MKKLILILTFILPSFALAEISYQEILKNPDDVTLNQKFATERLENGDAKAALAAIERILIQEPANLPMRLLRAHILIAMGSDLQARGELKALKLLPLQDNIATQVSSMLTALNHRQTRWTSFATLGFGYMDSNNVNNFPDSGQAELPQGISNFVSSNGSRNFNTPVSDEAFMSNIGLYTEYDLLNQNTDKLFAHFNASKVFGSDTEFMEYTNYGVRLGAKINRFTLEIIPSVNYNKIKSKTQPTTTSKTISLEVNKSLTSQITLFTTASFNRRNYEQNQNYPAANNADVDVITANTGIAFPINNSWRAIVSASYQDIKARLETVQYNSKESTFARLALQGYIARGQILNMNVQIGKNNHDAVDSSAQRIRHDDVLSYGVNYQIAGEALHHSLRKLRLTAGYIRNQIDSNILQFDNNRITKSIMINYAQPL